MNDNREIPENQSDDKPISIIHPVHQSEDSYIPFVHAIKLAYMLKAELEIVDVRSDNEAIEHLGVRSILEKWGVLPPGSHRGDVMDIGLRVKKIVREKGNKRQEIVKRIERHNHDILVMGTEKRSLTGSLFSRSLGEYLSEYFHESSFLIPSGCLPFVDAETGQITIDRIVIPLGEEIFQTRSFSALRWLLKLLPEIQPEIIGIYAGKQDLLIDESLVSGLNYRQESRDEPVVEAILNQISRCKSNLVIMSTNGRDTFTRKILGSNTEQVLRSASCPLLSINA